MLEEIVTLVLQKWTIFFINISLSCLFCGHLTVRRLDLLINARRVQMQKQQHFLPMLIPWKNISVGQNISALLIS